MMREREKGEEGEREREREREREELLPTGIISCIAAADRRTVCKTTSRVSARSLS